MIEGLDKGTIIAICSFLGLLVAIIVPLITFAVNMLLGPVKAEQKQLQNGQSRLEKGQAVLKTELQKEFQTGQAVKTELKNLKDMINLLLKDKWEGK